MNKGVRVLSFLIAAVSLWLIGHFGNWMIALGVFLFGWALNLDRLAR